MYYTRIVVWCTVYNRDKKGSSSGGSGGTGLGSVWVCSGSVFHNFWMNLESKGSM